MVDAVTGLNNLINKLQKLSPQIRELMEETVEDAAETWVDVIETSGTDRFWKSAWKSRRDGSYRRYSGRGRIDTGNMRDSMKGRVTQQTHDRVVGVVGWQENTEPYMIYQDVGFTHNLTGEHIAGMQGKREAYEEGKASLKQGLTEIVKREL